MFAILNDTVAERDKNDKSDAMVSETERPS